MFLTMRAYQILVHIDTLVSFIGETMIRIGHWVSIIYMKLGKLLL